MKTTIWILEKVFMLLTLPVLPVLILGYSVGKNGPVANLTYKIFFPLCIVNSVVAWLLIYKLWWL